MLTAADDRDLHVLDGEDLAGRIVECYQRLRAHPNLAPCPTVDALFAILVAACCEKNPTLGAEVVIDHRIAGIRAELLRLCAVGETLLEDTWAQTVIHADDAWDAVAKFPYLGNYEQLSRLELHALAAVSRDLATSPRICFVGGGPLPLSAILLHRATRSQILIVDHDSNAVQLATEVVSRLAPSGGIGVVTADAQSPQDMASAVEGCQVIVLAALVGLDRPQKQAVLRTLARVAAPGTHLVLRSANGLRSLLYPEVDLADVHEAGLTPQILVHPLGEVVNSVLVALRR